ncbi:seven-hairpin glycosidase [Eremomyces bilateralis CBS 781.70]|uniref:alpha-1,2-Mannosidase n=1 Tax=Eremomyces bilateralis CBS 781.70 TaxID=1392243 RepID=A0A6G1FZI2_9PEZI|nr:seven-hairpin glycosidase [Eremomyces bilateralis CBS 781.70]KAF1811188.1 seven-hairpin glycosidase [Eremomyces bilateralis CBS 781.70]
MIRYRRYRAVLVLAGIVVFLLYNLSAKSSWKSVTHVAESGSGHLSKSDPDKQWPAADTNGGDGAGLDDGVHNDESIRRIPPAEEVEKPAQKPSPSKTAPSKTKTSPSAASDNNPYVGGALPPIEDVLLEHSAGRFDVEPLSIPSPIFWARQPEHFPVQSTIPLPSGTPKAIPKIQFEFKEESAKAKTRREERLAMIQDSMAHAWRGYKATGWGHDEIRPVSGKKKDPFNGWGATLIDSLDTLWIMGMVEEFEEGLKHVEKVNFKTSERHDIPVFETTIRYLGGLIGAYDLSDGKYPILLEKAVELAEILMGVFDTPNRMPVPYYQWKPAFASQPHRSTTSIVLAELGSLAVEFTRLAQLTKESKYYDAIARITDALDEYQDRTRVPGLWPTRIDASGCQRQSSYGSTRTVTVQRASTLDEEVDADESVRLAHSNSMQGTTKPEDTDENGEVPLKKPMPIIFKPSLGKNKNPAARAASAEENTADDTSKSSEGLSKRQLSKKIETVPQSGNTIPVRARGGEEQPATPECTPQGLASTSQFATEEYTLASMADSAYEYLPKMHLLLGGLSDQYNKMYIKATEAAKDKLIFRPMLPDEDDVLISGTYYVSSQMQGEDLPPKRTGKLYPVGSHLNCFVGGMFALGGKIFNRKEDTEIGAKLTDACIWNYLSTTSGIMPETFTTIPCKSTAQCKWNETRWMEILDPFARERQGSYLQQLETYQSAMKGFDDDEGPAEPLAVVASNPTNLPYRGQQDNDDDERPSTGTVMKRDPDSQLLVPQMEDVGGEDPASANKPMKGRPLILRPSPPSPPLSHEEYVQTRVREERIPKGYAAIMDKRYLLRPEAIESVFYLYRITGDPKYREAGWKMFENVDRRTRTTIAASAIDDVTKGNPLHRDEMESFWTAETLKYFYLLFAKEDVVSLDDWVFNTEAHPFKMPTSPPK